MDFSVIFQLRTKKFWWMDVIFYFVISLLIATVLCYLIFLTKNMLQTEDIKKETVALQTVGTDQQKEYEKNVINYRNKINDFTNLFQNHEFASNVFAFMQTQTMPDVWFKQFSLDEKGGTVQLSGESDSLDALSRQVLTFEKNKYVKNIGTLSSSLGQSSRVEFNINLALDQNIFGYLSDMSSVLETASSLEQPLAIQGQTSPTNSPAVNQSAVGQQTSQTPSGEKLITSFHILLNPEVIGVVDQTNDVITLSVPYGTDVKNLTPSMVISPLATVLPADTATQNFTDPITYTVVAQDGSSQSYKVSVNVLPKAVKKSSNSGLIIIITVLVVIIIAVIAAASFLIWKRMQNQKTKF